MDEAHSMLDIKSMERYIRSGKEIKNARNRINIQILADEVARAIIDAENDYKSKQSKDGKDHYLDTSQPDRTSLAPAGAGEAKKVLGELKKREQLKGLLRNIREEEWTAYIETALKARLNLKLNDDYVIQDAEEADKDGKKKKKY